MCIRDRGHAGAADRAFIVEEHQFLVIALALRVVTPHAVEGTSLEKQGRADAVAVMHGKLLDVKYIWSFHQAPPFKTDYSLVLSL